MEPPVVRAAFVVVGIARGFTHEPVWRSILENGVADAQPQVTLRALVCLVKP